MLLKRNEKIYKLPLTKDNYYVIIDFDQTLTSKDSANSWDGIVHSGYLHPEHRKKHQSSVDFYQPIERNQSLELSCRIAAMEKWYAEIFELFHSYSYPTNLFEICVSHGFLKFRDGAIPFLQKLSQRNVPVIILSAGLGNTIQAFLKFHHCDFPNVHIISNFIMGDSISTPGNFVFACNKNMQKLPNFLAELIKKRPYTLLLGDVLDDIHMVEEKQLPNTLSIGFWNSSITKSIEPFNETFDIVFSEDSSFDEVQDILSIKKR